MRFYYFNKFLILILVSFSFTAYQVGDQISESDQNRRHDVCYGAEHHGLEEDQGHGGGYTLALGDLNGFTNDSGIFYVTMIDMAASW